MSAAILAGARDVGTLVECSGAGAECGGCWPALESLLAGRLEGAGRGMVER